MKLPLSKLSRQNQLLIALFLALLLLLAATLGNPRPVEFNTEFEGAAIQITADKSWSLFPGDCLEINWQVEGIESIYIDGQGKIGWGEMDFCPSFGAASPDFLITAQNGAARAFTLDTYFLPSEIVNCILFVALLFLFALAIYYVVVFPLEKPLPVSWSTLVICFIAVLACLLSTAYEMFSIRGLLQSLADLFASPAWQTTGLALGALVFVPILIQGFRRGFKAQASADFVAIAAFFVFLLVLYLPFGFESIGHQEEWSFHSYLEGRPSKISDELVSRFWILVPHATVAVVGTASFASYHVINLLMFFAQMALLYGILRRLRLSPFVAFLCSILFFVYPVNSSLMSLRSIVHNFNKLFLIAAVYLALQYRADASRLRLLGIWLALLFCVGSYEIGYAIILVIPLFWWLAPSAIRMGKFNLTLAWYLFPAAQLFYLLLLMTAGGNFYRSYVLGSLFESERSLLGQVGHYLGVLGDVYRQTLFAGWQEALVTMGENIWLTETAIALAVIGAAAVYLGRKSTTTTFPPRQFAAKALAGGLLFILPSVGVLLWLDSFNRDLWRMYIYVPIGAAVAVTSLLMLITVPVKRPVLRLFAVVCLYLMIMLPALSRLFLQHARFVESANDKAEILWQIVEQAPRFDPDSEVIVLTDMGLRELGENNIYDFRRVALDSAIYLLYEDNRPRSTVLCWNGRYCNSNDWLLTDFDIREVIHDTGKLVLFRLHQDLSVELLRELPPELGLDDRGLYNPDRLIDFAAPLPPRAVSMLGATVRGN